MREAAKDDYRFSSLVWQVVTSEPFRLWRLQYPETPEPAPTVTAQAEQATAQAVQ